MLKTNQKIKFSDALIRCILQHLLSFPKLFYHLKLSVTHYNGWIKQHDFV